MAETPVVIDYVLPDRRHSQGKQKAPLPSYTLALLLAQTPKTLLGQPVVARVHDEQAHGPYAVRFAQPDLLCLTYLTTGAPRAFELSQEAKLARSHSGRPVRVLHGGVHATSLPLEALEYSDVVVRGETTPEFQRRVFEEAIQLPPGEKRSFRVRDIPSRLVRPPADWSWMDPANYILSPSIQTSVGCPFHCGFCSVTEVFGASMRATCETSLIEELERAPRGRLLAIIDDNFLQGVQPRHVEHCLQVARLLHEHGRKWVAEVTVRTLIEARERLRQERAGFDLIEFFARNGCRGFFFGLESLDEEGHGLKKAIPVARSLNLIRDCQANGIGVLGAFVLGVGPDETPDTAKRLLEFAVETARLDFAQFSINTPMPGAHNFMEGVQNRSIFSFDWELYDAEHCVMRHPRLSPEALEEQHRWLYTEFYSLASIQRRFDLLPLLGLNPAAWRRALACIPANLILHHTNRSWNDRLDYEKRRTPTPAPHPRVTEQIERTLVGGMRALFDVSTKDELAVAI